MKTPLQTVKLNDRIPASSSTLWGSQPGDEVHTLHCNPLCPQCGKAMSVCLEGKKRAGVFCKECGVEAVKETCEGIAGEWRYITYLGECTHGAATTNMTNRQCVCNYCGKVFLDFTALAQERNALIF